MKKLISLLLVLVTVLSMVVPAAAEDNLETGYLSATMTQEEFMTSESAALFRFEDSQSLNGLQIHEKGYYYTHIQNQSNTYIRQGYAIAESGFSWKKSGSLGREAWVSNKHINLNAVVGMSVNSSNFKQVWASYSQNIFAGVWGYRYDNPGQHDRYSNRIVLDASYTYNTISGVIESFTVRAVLEDHIYYRDSLIKTRDQEVAKVAAEANKMSNQFQAMMYIHDYLIESAEYDYRDVALNSIYFDREEFYYAHSSFGVLNRNLGVCESYAKSFKLICDKLDNSPECALIISDTHMWNIVQLDGRWYCLDATWDDHGGDGIADIYFLCGDPDVVDGASTDHVPVSKFNFYPQYASGKYHTHSVSYVSQTNATAYTDGLRAHYRCYGCGMYFTNSSATNRTTKIALTIVATYHSHTMKFLEPVVATENCTGVQGHYRCTGCGKRYIDAYGNYETTLQNMTLDVLPHVLTYVAQQNATEDATGVKAHYRCYNCGKYYTDAQGKNETTLKALTIAKLAKTAPKPSVTIKNVSGGVEISWKVSHSADKYYIYRRTSSKSSWKKIKETTALKYVDTSVTAASQYQYMVRSVRGKLTSDSGVVTIKYLKTQKPAVTNASSGMTVSWSKIKGASGYTVYRRQKASSGWSGWKNLGNTKSLSYTDKSVTAGKDYQYGIVAYSGNYKAYCTASNTVRRLVVGTVKSSVSGNTIVTSWGKAAGATDYVVYRSQQSGKKWGSWKAVATTSKTTYTDKNTKTGVSYKYRVCARNAGNQSAYQEGNSVIRLATPTVTVTVKSKSFVAKWGKVTGASGYTVYRRQKTSSGWSGWKNLGNTKSKSYTDKKISAGVQYQYTVRAYSGSIKSEYKASATVCILSTPKVTIANDAGGVKVSWGKISGADSYDVYRSYKKSGKWTSWKKVTNVKGTSLVDKTATSNTDYKYYVVAIAGSSKSSYKASASLKYLATPAVSVSIGDKQITATWKKITGAKGYTVYRREKTSSGWSGWKNLGNQTALTYTDKKVTVGVEYQYTVKAYSGSVLSGMAASKSAALLTAPKVTVENGVEGIVAKWSKVTGASQYKVYRRELSGNTWSSWTQVALTKELSYIDTAFENGKTYQYTARAMSGSATSGYKASASIMFLAAPVVEVSYVNVKWEPVEGAEEYLVYRRVWNDDKVSAWTKLDVVKDTCSYNDITAESGYLYEYTVRAVSGNFRSAYREGATTYYLEKTQIEIFSQNGTVTVRFKPVNGATEYVIRRSEGGSWKTVYMGNRATYTDTSVVAGKTYQYYAQARNVSGFSEWSNIVYITVR